MDINEVCTKIAQQFDGATQSHLAILGSIVLNVVMLVRVWLTSRETAIDTKSIKRTINGGSNGGYAN